MSSAATKTSTLTSTKKFMYGLSVINAKLQDSVLRWVANAIQADVGGPLKRLHLIAFDSHTKTMPLRFLQCRPTSLALLESLQHSAHVQREFVAKYLAEQRQSNSVVGNSDQKDFVQPTLLAAYHASFKDLLVPSKSKPYNERFLRAIFQPDAEYFMQTGVESHEIATVAFGCLPSPALQRALLNSLYAQWIAHVYNRFQRELSGKLRNQPLGIGTTLVSPIKTVYDIADFTLITLLHSTTFAQLICGKYDPHFVPSNGIDGGQRIEWRNAAADLVTKTPTPCLTTSTEAETMMVVKPTRRKRVASNPATDFAGAPLDFFAKSHRHFSFLFNVLFDVRLLNGWEGFAIRESFAPIPPDFKETSHAEKLDEIGLKRDHFYAISIRARSIEELSKLLTTLRVDLRADIEEIVRIAFWLTDFTTKFRGTKPFHDELARLLDNPTAVATSTITRLVNEVAPYEFLGAYASVRAHFADKIEPALAQRYAQFRDQFLQSSARSYVD